ncbi:hypothetical protein RI367_004810 [Sorochytrium milnesiophthora]
MTSASAATIVSLQNDDVSLPPLVPPSTKPTVAHTLRQRSVNLLFQEYKRLLAGSLTDKQQLLPHVMALGDECELHDQYGRDAEQYKMKSRAALLALRRRKETGDLLQGPVGKRKGAGDSSEDDDTARKRPRLTVSLDMAAVHKLALSEDDLIHLVYPNWETLEKCLAAAPPSMAPAGGTDTAVTRECDRCRKRYLDSDTSADCAYHWGRLRTRRTQGERVKDQGAVGSLGCTYGPHVFKQDDLGVLHVLEPFEVTPVAHDASGGERYCPLVALDCEMCYTTAGFELCRLSAVDQRGKVVINELVKPAGRVVDLNSRWSGIYSLDDAKYTLPEIRAKLFRIIDQRTVLVGHSLEGDLKVMRGLPYRLALRTVAAEHLKRFVQQDSAGHDSLEDAETCLELLDFRLRHPELGSLAPPTSHLLRRLSVTSHSNLRDVDRAHAQRLKLISERRQRLAQQLKKVEAIHQSQKRRVQQESRTRLDHITESIDAAGKKRQSLLELQKQQWSSNVDKAKRIAARIERVRTEQSQRTQRRITEKIERSDALRQQLLGVSKSHLLTAVADVTVRTAAAVKIQRLVRAQAVMQASRALLLSTFSSHRLAQLDFDGCARLVQSKAVTRAMGKLFNLANRQLAEQPQIEAKKVLSAYMAVAHPREVFSEMTADVQALLGLAEKLVHAVDVAVSRASVSRPAARALPLRLVSVYTAYAVAFEAWRRQDAARLMQMVMDHYHELDAFWAEVRVVSATANDVLEGVAERQRLLRDRLRNMGGEEAIAELERQRVAKEVDVTQAPEALYNAGTRSCVDSVLSQRKASTSPFAPEPTELAPAAEGNDADVKQTSDRAPSALLSNIELAHAVVVDPDYRMEPDRNSLHYAMQATVKRAYFDQLREHETANNYLPWFIELIADAKEKLMSQVSEKGTLHANISRLLDQQYIQQQLEQGVLDFVELFRNMQKLVSEMCAPVRDREVRQLADHTSVVDFMAHYLEVVDNMKLDMANMQLTLARPTLLKHIADYERSHFHQMLDKQETTLAKTTAWLEAAAIKLQETAESRNPEGVILPKVRFENVWNEAFLDLLFSASLDGAELPETLYLDGARLASYRSSIEDVARWAAALAHVRTHSLHLRRDPADLKKLFDEHTAESLRPFNFAEFLARVAVLDPELRTERLQGLLDNVQTGKDPVFKVITRRIEAVIRTRMTTNTFKVESLKGMGLDLVVVPMDKLSRNVACLCALNKQVYAEWYDAILGQLV